MRAGLSDGLLVLTLVLLQVVTWPDVVRELPGHHYTQDWRDPALVSAALALAVLARRRWPLTSLLVLAVGGVTADLFGVYAWTVVALGMLAASYSIGRRLALFRSLLSLGVALTLEPLVHWVQALPAAALESLLFVVLLVGSWWVGRLVRTRAFHLAELRLRAQRIQQAQDVHARAVLTEERSRIARELHDVVAHHVSVMTVQATAGRRIIDRDPARASQTLTEIETNGRAALAEMRRLVEILRTTESNTSREETPPAETAPQPDLDGLDELIQQIRDTGVHVELTVDHPDRDTAARPPLPHGLELTLYRLAQEALTNVLKHTGPGTHASVLLRFTRTEVALEIVDDGVAGTPGTQRTSRFTDTPGHGLLGMAERVALFDGELSAGPRPERGFAVRARVPLPASAPLRGE